MTKSRPKSWGSDLYAGHKVKTFFQPLKYAVSDRVEPRDSVLLCDVVPLGRGIRHRLLPVVHCQFTVAYLHGAFYSLLLIDRMVSVTHQWSRRRHRRLAPPRSEWPATTL